jgi:transcription initiation factor TFIID subunit 2
MPGRLLDDDMEPIFQEQAPLPQEKLTFVVQHQKVELDIDLATQSLTGRTTIHIIPKTKHLRDIRLDARQCVISTVKVGPSMGIAAEQVNLDENIKYERAPFEYEDPMKKLNPLRRVNWTANQHTLQHERVGEYAESGSLTIKLPPKVRIEEEEQSFEAAAASIARASSVMLNGIPEPQSATPTTTPKIAHDNAFKEIRVQIEFSISNFRDGLHFVGLTEGDSRYPHVYTRHSVDSGTASCIFPCLDNSSPSSRWTWDIFVTCSRTLGDAVKRPPPLPKQLHGKNRIASELPNGLNDGAPTEDYQVQLSDEEKLLEMTVVCSGRLENETTDVNDGSRKTIKFSCNIPVAPRHIGFAIGPFEQVDLGLENREEDDEETLAQGQAMPVFGYCLPGRSDELRNTCISVVHALDWLMLHGGSFPFQDAKLVFVDDQTQNVAHTASLSICRNQLLYPEDIIDTERDTLRILVHALASQWFGVSMVPEYPKDRWVTIGLSHYLTGLYMKVRMGTNDYLFRYKVNADRLVELDVERPSLDALGELLKLGSFEYDFMSLKAELVLFILDKRIIKASASAGLSRVMQKIITASHNAGDSVLSTKSLKTSIDKITKYRHTERFLEQWVEGAGCPKFSITQKFNKKKFCVEMKIIQNQSKLPENPPPLDKNEFLRLYKEEQNEVTEGGVQRVFTGPMTIRIHEADGTPYEHVVEIREGSVSFDIPYSTKYKRLKRSRRAKERANASVNVDENGEIGEDALYYCLGDVLQSEKEAKDWELKDWSDEMQAKMDAENYEWVRVDADFEWICAKEFIAMPTYMYISQLQQDRDVVAHLESMQYLRKEQPHPLLSTFLVRTLMDSRYFWGIRVMAADILQNNAVQALDWIGFKHLEKAYQELFCYPGGKTPQPNNFEDMRRYFIMKAIPAAVAKIRHTDGKCPKECRNFVLDQLRFNDNQQNDFSDNFKVASLLSALTDCLIPTKLAENEIQLDETDEDDPEPAQFQQSVIEELDRHRRMDEWMQSYQNIYTVTVLECKLKLMQAGIIAVDPFEFAKYIHDGTADQVRLTAFKALLDLGYTTNDSVTTYLLNVMSTNNSPYLRNKLFGVFSLGLATVAVGKGPEKQKEAPTAFDADGDLLLVENEPVPINDSHLKEHILRTRTIVGAMKALKKDLGENSSLKDSIWKAVFSPTIGAFEQINLLYVCDILYDSKDSMTIQLDYPRYLVAEKTSSKVNIVRMILYYLD